MYVVDLLELVDIADRQGQAIVVPTLLGKRAGQDVGKRPAVESAGQGLVRGLVGQRVVRLAQSCLQLDHAPAPVDSCTELAGVERFGQVVVGSGLQSRDDVGLLAPGRQDDDVGRLVGL